ncbi:VPLPA-CTERM sorting domain-containing protein [Desulfobacca acetoxidans]|uniref:PEP motif anchor domain protein n=1 Tax=Desulfobacca acetoxidans (strain ATCC 700848 / DSM 11109 / ASRB2) TaxID=880072 RepID=F2NHU8_DESAR|nr:VPLPA-CTERM sorting domain-containing protein [Desulfobacca acetoxidans]AEB09433.1 protein of unknown function DUF1555 [Desulfobacca acetoxidans DSM 11109]
MKRTSKILVLALGLVIVLSVGQAAATTATYFFYPFGGDLIEGAKAGLASEMYVSDEPGDLISGYSLLFKFSYNYSNPPNDSAITKIAFYDGILDTNYAMAWSGNIDLIPLTEAVPEFKSYFKKDGDFLMGLEFNKTEPVEKGIGFGESLSLYFNPKTGFNTQAVFDGLYKAAVLYPGPYTTEDSFPENGLAVAIKIQGLPESSELVNTVPLPGAMLLLGTGLARLAACLRRRKD